jgi:hypothetical protein
MESEGSLPHLQVSTTCPYPEPGTRLSLKSVCNRINFSSEELLAPRPTPKLENHPLSDARHCLFNIRSYPPYWRPFLHMQPEDMPCHGDRNPRIMSAHKYDYQIGE